MDMLLPLAWVAAATGIAPGVRPGYHYTRPSGWMNDPVPFYDAEQRRFHLFHICDPNSTKAPWAGGTQVLPARAPARVCVFVGISSSHQRPAGPRPGATRHRSTWRRSGPRTRSPSRSNRLARAVSWRCRSAARTGRGLAWQTNPKIGALHTRFTLK